MSQNGSFKLSQRADAFVEKGPLRKSDQTFRIGGFFTIECYDEEGNLKWKDTAKNGVTNDGLDGTLNTFFRNGTTLAGWALGLIDGPGVALAATDTHDSHAGWSENTDYVEATRPLWAPNATSTQSLVNPSLVDFNINNNGITISGLFLVGGTIGGGATDADTKGSIDAAPLLWATALLTGGDQTLNSGDVLRVNYTVDAQSA